MRSLLALAFCLLPTFSFAADEVVLKAKFIEAFKAGAPGVFCTEKTFFRSCYDLKEDTCKKAAAAALEACLVEQGKEIPAELRQPADGQNWGKKLGACTGKKISEANEKTKKDTADCNDPAKWQ